MTRLVFFFFHILAIPLLQPEEPPLSVLHIQYPEWPDHGVPGDTIAVREVLKRIYHLPADLGPIVVHCRFSSELTIFCWPGIYIQLIFYLFLHISKWVFFLSQCRYRENWCILYNSPYNPESPHWRHVCFRSSQHCHQF